MNLLDEPVTEKELKASKEKWKDPAGTTDTARLKWCSDQFSPLAMGVKELTDMDSNTTLGILFQESRGNPRFLNQDRPGNTAFGLFQITEDTAEIIGRKLLDMKNPALLYKRLEIPEVSALAFAKLVNRLKLWCMSEFEPFLILGHHMGGRGLYEAIQGYARDVAKLDPEILKNKPAFDAWMAERDDEERSKIVGYIEKNYPKAGHHLKEVLKYKETFIRLKDSKPVEP